MGMSIRGGIVPLPYSAGLLELDGSTAPKGGLNCSICDFGH